MIVELGGVIGQGEAVVKGAVEAQLGWSKLVIIAAVRSVVAGAISSPGHGPKGTEDAMAPCTAMGCAMEQRPMGSPWRGSRFQCSSGQGHSHPPRCLRRSGA